MNVFEDLIVELKQENLLEETVIDRYHPNTFENDKFDLGFEFTDSRVVPTEIKATKEPQVVPPPNGQPLPKAQPVRGKDTAQKLAERISALQMAQFVFSGVERDVRGSVEAEPFDDLVIKKAFHRFAQASADDDNDKYFDAEAELLGELGSWETALRDRDRRIPVAALRRYCESANPPLSSQALFAIAKFYRTSEFSEQTRAKFEAVVTRLFSKPAEGQKRETLCSRSEIEQYLKQKYAVWITEPESGTVLNSSELAALSMEFDNFVSEAASAGKFSDLVSTGLFKRLYERKQRVAARFFYPQVAASAIECNTRITARIIDLIASEQNRRALLVKHGEFDDSTLSDSVGRTLELALLVEGKSVKDVNAVVNQPVATQQVPRERRDPEKKDRRQPRNVAQPTPTQAAGNSAMLFGLNRWVLMFAAFAIVVCLAIYVMAAGT